MPFIGTNPVSVISTSDAVLLYNASTAGNTSNTSNADFGASIDTNGYGSFVWEISGNASFQLYIQGSNDQNLWVNLWTLPAAEVSVVDTIEHNGIYVSETSTRYIRYYIAYTSGTISQNVYGRSGPGLDSVGRLTTALDPFTGHALNVNVQNLKKDASSALVPSDSAGPFVFQMLSASSYEIIDTTGYNSIVIQQISGGSSPVTISNDGLTWVSAVGVNLNNGVPATTLSAGGIFAFTCAARYTRIQGTATGGQIVVYLRTNPVSVLPTTTTGLEVNVGTSITGGTIATLTGGGTAVASPVASNPLTVGAADSAGLVRRLLTTGAVPFGTSNTTFAPANTIGSLVTAGVDQASVNRPLGLITGGFENTPALSVMDVTQNEGASRDQLLSQILLELQILNHQLHQLPLLLNSGISQSSDEPLALRQETSLFNTQNQ